MDSISAFIPRLFAWQLVLLYVLAGSVLVIHFRGRARLGFARQLTDHSTFMAPYNVLMYAFSKTPKGPFIPVETLPELAEIRENWRTIREEAVALFDAGRVKTADAYNDAGFNSFFRTGWKRFYVKW